MDILSYFLPLIGAFLYRLQNGGFFCFKHPAMARLCWAVPTGLLLLALSWSSLPASWVVAEGVDITGIVAGVALVLMCSLALVVTGEAVHEHMGRDPQDPAHCGGPFGTVTFWMPHYRRGDPAWKRELIDFIGMSVVGAVRGVLSTLPIGVWNPTLAGTFTAAFALAGMAYWVGHRLHRLMPRLIAGPQWGEMLTGLAVYGAFPASVTVSRLLG